MQTFTTEMIDGRAVLGILIDNPDIAKMSVGGAALCQLADRLIMVCIGPADSIVELLERSGQFGPVRDLATASLWTCGHDAGSACAECYHDLAGKAAALAIQVDADANKIADLEIQLRFVKQSLAVMTAKMGQPGHGPTGKPS